MQSGVEQHRGVSGGQNEAITIGPERIEGIVAKEILPERVHDRSEAHRGAGMAGVGLLDRIDGESANGIDAELIEIRLGGWLTDGLTHGLTHMDSWGRERTFFTVS